MSLCNKSWFIVYFILSLVQINYRDNTCKCIRWKNAQIKNEIKIALRLFLTNNPINFVESEENSMVERNIDCHVPDRYRLPVCCRSLSQHHRQLIVCTLRVSRRRPLSQATLSPHLTRFLYSTFPMLTYLREKYSAAA